jgi:hypothetical protein
VIKPWERTKPAPGLGDGAARSSRTNLDFNRPGEDGNLDTIEEDTGGRPRAIGDSIDSADVDISRDRHVTTASPISASLAERMVPTGASDSARVRRDPAAPLQEPEQHTRRVGEDDAQHTRRVGDSDRRSLGPSRLPTRSGRQDAGRAACRQRAAAFIDGARAAMENGDVAAAVTAAERALREADQAAAPGIVEIIEPARALLAQVFSAYVGPLSGVPVLAPGANEIARCLGERERGLLARIDGKRTLDALFDGSGLGSTDALRLVARMIKVRAVRVI